MTAHPSLIAPAAIARVRKVQPGSFAAMHAKGAAARVEKALADTRGDAVYESWKQVRVRNRAPLRERTVAGALGAE